jgi:HEAT repeat protein
MPGPLFILSREKERAAIDEATFDPGKRELLYQMVEAVWKVRETGQVTRAELAPIRAGFQVPEEGVWSRAGTWLARLVDFAPELTSVVDELAMHRDDDVRSRLCASLTDRHFPDSLIWPRLKRFLTDHSDQVREAAVRVCIKRQNSRMIPPLQAALEAEQDAGRRSRLRMAIALIKGEPYWLTEEP